MKTELVNITPAKAREWLKSNTENRPLRPNVVEGFHIAWGRGEWKSTHQGIAFGKSGRLIDGQHRLTFISQLPESTSVAMNVTRDLDEQVFGAIDQGCRRSASDVLGVSMDLAATGRFMARIVNSSMGVGLSVQYIAPFVEWVTPEYEELVTYCPSKVRIWSSSGVKAAAILQMKRGMDWDFVKMSYHSLVAADIDAMPHGARALMQQHMSGKIVSARTLDLFCRALRAFDSTKNFKIRSINVPDQAGVLEEVRQYIMQSTKKGPAKAGPTVAKPDGKFKALRGE